MESHRLLAPILAVIRGDAALGDFGAYTGVCEIGFGLETFIAGPTSHPIRGERGKVTTTHTAVVTTLLRATASEPVVREGNEDVLCIYEICAQSFLVDESLDLWQQSTRC